MATQAPVHRRDFGKLYSATTRQALITAEERVKQQVAELLHGPVQTGLLLASLNIGKSLDLIRTAPDEAQALLQQVRRDVDKLREHDVRHVSRLLHPSVLRVGVAAAVRALARQFRDHIHVDVYTDGTFAEMDCIDMAGLPSSWRLASYRIIEECLNNVYFHAQATNVRVSLEVVPSETGACYDGSMETKQRLRLTVIDDGRGFDPRNVVSGLGWQTIAARASELSGTVCIDSCPGEGTTVRVHLALPETKNVMESTY